MKAEEYVSTRDSYIGTTRSTTLILVPTGAFTVTLDKQALGAAGIKGKGSPAYQTDFYVPGVNQPPDFGIDPATSTLVPLP